MPPDTQDLLDQLSAKVLSHMDQAGMIADIRVTNAQISAKLDNALTDLGTISGKVPDLERRVDRMETNWTWVKWVVGALWGVVLLFIGAYAYKIINGGSP